jgi:hypothetical protein
MLMVDVLREEAWSVAYVLQTERFEAIIELRAPGAWVATLRVWSDLPQGGAHDLDLGTQLPYALPGDDRQRARAPRYWELSRRVVRVGCGPARLGTGG